MNSQKGAGDVSAHLLRIWLRNGNEKYASAVLPGQLRTRTLGRRTIASANALALVQTRQISIRKDDSNTFAPRSTEGTQIYN
eukprot:4765153-Pyramimonas_sp.AAC.1